MKRTRRTFTPEYKLEAVGLLSSGARSLSSVTRDLDLDPKLLRRWREELKQEGAGAFPGKGHLRPEEGELKLLRRENERLREEREILKKALAIFSGARQG
ncbi:MAG TPA: transposase [Thermoanaerobaculia bacterium]|nr:transposase [Thermoanaerobaculia bacterium]